MESEDVDLVRDLRMGERPRSAKYIKRADLNVFRRAWLRGEIDLDSEVGDRGYVGECAGADMVSSSGGNGSLRESIGEIDW